MTLTQRLKSVQNWQQKQVNSWQKEELKKALTLKAQIETTERALKNRLMTVEARRETLVEQGYTQ